MKDISIKVVIAGKPYSLAVKAEEEENAWKASKLIEEKLRDFEQNYGVKDKQDLLAMCALQLANEIIQGQDKKAASEGLEEELSSIESLLDGYLKKV